MFFLPLRSVDRPLFQKCCGNCKFHEKLTHGPKDLYFRCICVARSIQLFRDGAKPGAFLNAILCVKLGEKTECLFWRRK